MLRELMLAWWQGISGAFRPETLTALMGVTGAGESCVCRQISLWLSMRVTSLSADHGGCCAGKTTLMDVLAGRKTSAVHMQTLIHWMLTLKMGLQRRC